MWPPLPLPLSVPSLTAKVDSLVWSSVANRKKIYQDVTHTAVVDSHFDQEIKFK